MVRNKKDRNGLSNISYYLWIISYLLNKGWRSSRYSCGLINKNIQKVISTTSYPQLHSHVYTTGNTDWLQCYWYNKTTKLTSYTDQTYPSQWWAIQVIIMFFWIFPLTFDWVWNEIFRKLWYWSQSI